MGGLEIEGGATEFNLEDADVKRAMIASARDVIILADSSKFHQTGFAHVMDLAQAATIITDSNIDPDMLQSLRDAGIQVDVVLVPETRT